MWFAEVVKRDVAGLLRAVTAQLRKIGDVHRSPDAGTRQRTIYDAIWRQHEKQVRMWSLNEWEVLRPGMAEQESLPSCRGQSMRDQSIIPALPVGGRAVAADFVAT